MNPLLHWGNYGIIRGSIFGDPLGGLGRCSSWIISIVYIFFI